MLIDFFLRYNVEMLSGFPVELFSLDKDIYGVKKSSLSDENFITQMVTIFNRLIDNKSITSYQILVIIDEVFVIDLSVIVPACVNEH